ncbi:MAG: CPBP family intramembrane glutamic endopeptidase [Bacteroidota bacterium]
MNFIQQAYKGKTDWWRFVLTIFLVFFGWQVIGGIPITITAYFAAGGDLGKFAEASQDMFISLGINSNLYLLMMILTFFFGLVALFLGIKYIHFRKFTSLITSREKVDWSRIVYSFLLWSAISVFVLSLGFLFTPEDFSWNFKPLPFFTLVIISFLFLPFQTSFEELLFRGYFMQGLGILFKNATVPLIVTSVAFGLLHGFNPEVAKLGKMIMVYYIGTGFMFGITTLMDEGTELALGMHAANNIVAAVVVTSDWMVFQTDALFVDTSEPSVNLEAFVPVFVIYPIVLRIFSKKYAWKEWNQKLFGAIEKPY